MTFSKEKELITRKCGSTSFFAPFFFDKIFQNKIKCDTIYISLECYNYKNRDIIYELYLEFKTVIEGRSKND